MFFVKYVGCMKIFLDSFSLYSIMSIGKFTNLNINMIVSVVTCKDVFNPH